MAVVEGLGLVAPTAIPVTQIDGNDICQVIALGRTRALFRGYEYSPDSWKRGAFANAEKAIIMGCIGELAFARWTNAQLGREVLKPEFRLMQNGDPGWDFNVNGLTIDVKSVGDGPDGKKPLLVRRIHKEKLVPLKAHVYVMVSVFTIERPYLLGWCSRQRMTELKPSPICPDDWSNVVMPRVGLEKMNRLLKRIESAAFAGEIR